MGDFKIKILHSLRNLHSKLSICVHDFYTYLSMQMVPTYATLTAEPSAE